MSLNRSLLLHALTFGLLQGRGGPSSRPTKITRPEPTPVLSLRKGNNDMHVYNGRHAGWNSRHIQYMRRWAPEGGGARECARRRAQIQSGKLTGYVPTPR